MDEEIKIVLDGEEARRELERLDKVVEETTSDMEQLDRSRRKSGSRRRGRGSGGGSKGGSGGGLKDFVKGAAGTALAVVVAAKVAEVVATAVGKKLEEYGLKGAGQALQQLSQEVTGVTSALSQAAGALGLASGVATPFALAGVNPGGAIEASMRIGAGRAERDAQREQRRLGILGPKYADLAARVAGNYLK